MSHPLHTLVLNDGTVEIRLEPPEWREMSYAFTPVKRGSVFEAYDGSAIGQVNEGATAKWKLRVTIQALCAPEIRQLQHDRSWTVTLIDPAKIDAAVAYTMWHTAFYEPPQTINAREATRSWVLDFREA